jgi:hypothetical protein
MCHYRTVKIVCNRCDAAISTKNVEVKICGKAIDGKFGTCDGFNPKAKDKNTIVVREHGDKLCAACKQAVKKKVAK